jgi:hypothetical protein
MPINLERPVPIPLAHARGSEPAFPVCSELPSRDRKGAEATNTFSTSS